MVWSRIVSLTSLKGTTDPKGNHFTYTYDNKHRPTKAISAADVTTLLAYDSYGNVTKQGNADPAATAAGTWPLSGPLRKPPSRRTIPTTMITGSGRLSLSAIPVPRTTMPSGVSRSGTGTKAPHPSTSPSAIIRVTGTTGASSRTRWWPSGQ